MVRHREVDGGGAGGEVLDHLQDSLATLAGHQVLVKVGELLELADDLTKDELGLVVLLELPALRHVHGEPLVEQLQDLFRQLLHCLGGIILA